MTIPKISPVSATQAPLWSVMIPTYEPRTDYLARALGSVTAQLEPGADVQIEIVDDASPAFDPHEFLRGAGAGGVTWHRNQRRQGLAGNWNTCVERARGRWVHILHQDDFVLPGFYDAMRAGVHSAPAVGAAFCDTYFVGPDHDGRTKTTIEAPRAGVLEDWRRHVFVQLAIQTAAIVVPRSTYEAVGGYDDDFSYVLDWDLWKRIAVRFPLWYEPRPLACYRTHSISQTARLRRTGRNIAEIAASIARSESLLDGGDAADISRRARRAYSVFAVESALASALQDRSPAAALAQLAEARRMSSAAEVARAVGWVALRSVVRPMRDALLGPRQLTRQDD
jgi:glycosyltransferase involved in cell wall biosynthesis